MVDPTPASRQRMSTVHQVVNLIAFTLPVVALAAGVVLLWNRVVHWSDLGIMAVMYGATALGVTVGFHRLLTHRSFETYRPIRYLFAAVGSMSVQGPVIGWVADHRKHHTFSDEEGDPHSPHVGHGGGLRGALRGLFHAHLGWLLTYEHRAEWGRYARDLVRDPVMRAINASFLPLVALGLALPFGLGWLITGSWVGGLTALIWGGLVRIFLLHHVTFSINSICHFFGRRRFETSDESRNVPWLALPSLGESWHHNHHAFPTSAMHGLRPWEVDASGLVIGAMEKLGLAWNVVRVSPERQRTRATA